MKNADLPRYAVAIASFVMLAACNVAAAQIVAGAADVVDGDTLRIGGQRVRLHGIDAPEADQTCERDGERWPCGQVAAQHLASLIGGGMVSCRQRDIDPYDRIVASCHADGSDDLGRSMVQNGWAVAYRQYSDAYVADEVRATAERKGIWSSTFDLPEHYRQAARNAQGSSGQGPTGRQSSGSAKTPATGTIAHDGSCTIKGNRNRRGQWIYHLPGMPYYDRTRAEEMFCTEAQARAAGYRRAIVR